MWLQMKGKGFVLVRVLQRNRTHERYTHIHTHLGLYTHTYKKIHYKEMAQGIIEAEKLQDGAGDPGLRWCKFQSKSQQSREPGKSDVSV